MAKEQIEITVAADGQVQLHVKGVKGKSCVDLTREIEQKLGQVVERRETAEYYERPVTQQITQR